VLVMDAAYMVTVPFFCPDVPYLTKNPVFLFSEDGFQRPNPFTADIAVSIDDTIDKKLAAVEALHSQFFEGGANGHAGLVPDGTDAEKVAARKKAVREQFSKRFAATASRFRASLDGYYSKESKVDFAEAFEICEYGRRPSAEEIRKLFPFFPGK
ncbi:MAG TPA: PIG-L family deacetylase, partial [Planctomycetota bacterium]|nr:PIG-L family deacetylase [Planctomycetota bacterium]